MKTINIAIPAYKRPDQLNQCLISIADQIERYVDYITITVFDDSLTEINKSVIEYVCINYNCKINYIINTVNYGIDGNIENCLSYGDSTYILVLGEDDILLPNAFDEIYKIINTHSPDLIYTSYVYLSNDKTKVIRTPLSIAGFQDPEEFITNNLWAIGFIGSAVIKREFLNAKTKRYLGTFFNHVGRISSNLDSYSKIFASPIPLVGNRSDNLSTTTWSTSYYDVLFGFERLMVALSNDSNFGRAFLYSIASFRAAFGYLDIHRVCLMRSYGVFNSRIFDLYFANADGLKCKHIYYIISNIPTNFLNPLRLIFFCGRLVKRMLY